MITITIPGRAVPKGRPRHHKGRVYTPVRTEAYERSVRQWGVVAMRGCAPYNARLRVVIELRYTNRQHIGDIDNAAKALLDGLNGIAWEDDRLIDELTIKRSFGHDEEMAIVEVSILS